MWKNIICYSILLVFLATLSFANTAIIGDYNICTECSAKSLANINIISDYGSTTIHVYDSNTTLSDNNWLNQGTTVCSLYTGEDYASLCGSFIVPYPKNPIKLEIEKPLMFSQWYTLCINNSGTAYCTKPFEVGSLISQSLILSLGVIPAYYIFGVNLSDNVLTLGLNSSCSYKVYAYGPDSSSETNPRYIFIDPVYCKSNINQQSVCPSQQEVLNYIKNNINNVYCGDTSGFPNLYLNNKVYILDNVNYNNCVYNFSYKDPDTNSVCNYEFTCSDLGLNYTKNTILTAVVNAILPELIQNNLVLEYPYICNHSSLNIVLCNTQKTAYISCNGNILNITVDGKSYIYDVCNDIGLACNVFFNGPNDLKTYLACDEKLKCNSACSGVGAEQAYNQTIFRTLWDVYNTVARDPIVLENGGIGYSGETIWTKFVYPTLNNTDFYISPAITGDVILNCNSTHCIFDLGSEPPKIYNMYDLILLIDNLSAYGNPPWTNYWGGASDCFYYPTVISKTSTCPVSWPNPKGDYEKIGNITAYTIDSNYYDASKGIIKMTSLVACVNGKYYVNGVIPANLSSQAMFYLVYPEIILGKSYEDYNGGSGGGSGGATYNPCNDFCNFIGDFCIDLSEYTDPNGNEYLVKKVDYCTYNLSSGSNVYTCVCKENPYCTSGTINVKITNCPNPADKIIVGVSPSITIYGEMSSQNVTSIKTGWDYFPNDIATFLPTDNSLTISDFLKKGIINITYFATGIDDCGNTVSDSDQCNIYVTGLTPYIEYKILNTPNCGDYAEIQLTLKDELGIISPTRSSFKANVEWSLPNDAIDVNCSSGSNPCEFKIKTDENFNPQTIFVSAKVVPVSGSDPYSWETLDAGKSIVISCNSQSNDVCDATLYPLTSIICGSNAQFKAICGKVINGNVVSTSGTNLLVKDNLGNILCSSTSGECIFSDKINYVKTYTLICSPGSSSCSTTISKTYTFYCVSKRNESENENKVFIYSLQCYDGNNKKLNCSLNYLPSKVYYYNGKYYYPLSSVSCTNLNESKYIKCNVTLFSNLSTGTITLEFYNSTKTINLAKGLINTYLEASIENFEKGKIISIPIFIKNSSEVLQSVNIYTSNEKEIKVNKRKNIKPIPEYSNITFIFVVTLILLTLIYLKRKK